MDRSDSQSETSTSSTSLEIVDTPQDVIISNNKHLTKYEKAYVLGLRAEQLSRSAPINIKTDLTDPLDIAKAELRSRKLPFIIKRRVNNRIEHLALSECEFSSSDD